MEIFPAEILLEIFEKTFFDNVTLSLTCKRFNSLLNLSPENKYYNHVIENIRRCKRVKFTVRIFSDWKFIKYFEGIFFYEAYRQLFYNKNAEKNVTVPVLNCFMSKYCFYFHFNIVGDDDIINCERGIPFNSDSFFQHKEYICEGYIDFLWLLNLKHTHDTIIYVRRKMIPHALKWISSLFFEKTQRLNIHVEDFAKTLTIETRNISEYYHLREMTINSIDLPAFMREHCRGVPEIAKKIACINRMSINCFSVEEGTFTFNENEIALYSQLTNYDVFSLLEIVEEIPRKTSFSEKFFIEGRKILKSL